MLVLMENVGRVNIILAARQRNIVVNGLLWDATMCGFMFQYAESNYANVFSCEIIMLTICCR